jgi:hypothetical protein
MTFTPEQRKAYRQRPEVRAREREQERLRRPGRRAYKKAYVARDPEKWQRYSHDYAQRPSAKVAKRIAYHTPVGQAAAKAYNKRFDVQAKNRAAQRQRRALKYGFPFALPTALEPPLPATCVMCAAPFATEPHAIRPTIDRVIPSLGYVPGNVQWIHRSCNGTKGTMSLAEARAAGNDLVAAYIERHAPPAPGHSLDFPRRAPGHSLDTCPAPCDKRPWA